MYYGVPQGSILGSLLFSVYTLSLNNIIYIFSSVKYPIFADNIQLIDLSIITNSSDHIALIDCISMVKGWFLQN